MLAALHRQAGAWKPLELEDAEPCCTDLGALDGGPQALP
jgi:hypothetical protein